MAEKNWAAILNEEDRIIANSDRRFRYHCYSLESMSARNLHTGNGLSISRTISSSNFWRRTLLILSEMKSWPMVYAV